MCVAFSRLACLWVKLGHKQHALRILCDHYPANPLLVWLGSKPEAEHNANLSQSQLSTV